MKYIKLFEDYSGSAKIIAAILLNSVYGFGTDEAALVDAVNQIKSREELKAVDSELLIVSKARYNSVKDLVDKELGVFDST